MNIGKRQQGTAMMETVVSLFVLAIGLMGTLAMQANSVNSNQRANFATEANILASDMVDRILAYTSVDMKETGFHYAGVDTSNAPTSAVDCSGGCAKNLDAAGDQRKYDEWEWAQQVNQRLPGGVGTVRVVDTYYVVRLTWEQGDEFAGSNCANPAPAAGSACFEYKFRL
ncbi:type IV pilus assembly protein PilV [Alteromonadaceae bacterium Bs31]|nr:type IV pilus assembly protein PilV [Alteromonadaceae bacterium Bs31]